MIKEQKQHIKELKSLYKREKRYFAVLADCLFEYGQGNEAEKIIKENLSDYPDYITALLVWGKILYYKKNYEAAKEVFLQITKLNSSCVRAYKFLGDIELKLDNRDGYLAFYTEILRYDAFNLNAKNVITLLGKKYDFSAEDDMSSRYNSDPDIEQPEMLDAGKKEVESQLKKSIFSKSFSDKKPGFSRSSIDLGNVNYKDAIKEIDEQYVRNKKSDSKIKSPDEPVKAPTLPRPVPVREDEKSILTESIKSDISKAEPVRKESDGTEQNLRVKVEDLTRSKVDLFFQEQLAKPDKPKEESSSADKPLFHEPASKPPVVEKPIKESIPKTQPISEKNSVDNVEHEENKSSGKKEKDDSFSDVEAMFEQVTSAPANKPKISVSSLEKMADQKYSAQVHIDTATYQQDKKAENNAKGQLQHIEPVFDKNTEPEENKLTIERFTSNTTATGNGADLAFCFAESKEAEPEVKKSLKDYYQPVSVAVEQEAEFDLVEDIRKSGEFDSLETMMKQHDQTTAAEQNFAELPDSVIPQHERADSSASLLRSYDDIDLVEEERIYAQADELENGSDMAGGSIQIDVDNSFKKVVVDKVMGEAEIPKKRSFKIATSTLGEIYSAQGEYHKAKENYYELMSKDPDNSDYRIKFIQAEFNIAAIRINEELDYYRNLTEQFPDMIKYRERYESYQNEYNNLKAELDQKIEMEKLKNQNNV